MTRRKNIINTGDLEWTSTNMDGTPFEGQRKQLGRAAGGQRLGTSLMRLAPGKSAFPYHAHHGNEEAIYILEGTGTARMGVDRYPVGPGDYLAMPVGPEHAHQLTNTGDTDLVYLCVSTMIFPEVVTYPDSGKVGAFAGSAPGGPADQRHVSGFWMDDARVPYLTGELGEDEP